MTIRDVARQAGVSTATVSRVINGNSQVDACLVARVHQAVSSLGYVPNTVARSLKADRTMLVGLLISDIGNPYFSAIAKALESALGQHGYTLLIGSTEEGPEREQRLLDGMLGRKADGLILNSTGRNDAMLAAISQRLPVVLLNRRIRTPGFCGDLVDSDNREGARAMMRCLLDAGHRHIGVIHGDLSVSTGREREEGFLSVLGESSNMTGSGNMDGPGNMTGSGNMDGSGIVDGAMRVLAYQGDFSMESGMAGAEALLSGPQPVTAIAVMNNSMAIGVLRYCRRHAIRIPEDVSVVSYGSIEDADLLYVNPTVVALSPREVARHAAELLLARMRHPVAENREILLPPDLEKGNTVGPATPEFFTHPCPSVPIYS